MVAYSIATEVVLFEKLGKELGFMTTKQIHIHRK